MSGRDLYTAIRDAQEHKAAAALTWAQFSQDADAYHKYLKIAYDASGLRFKLSFDQFRAALETYWAHVDAEEAASDNR